MLIYIHGFNSSPNSFKANLLMQYAEKAEFANRLHVPELSSVPKEAIKQLKTLIEKLSKSPAVRPGVPISLIGSSLGGFYATWLAEKYNCRAVLINPAVRPYEFFKPYLGSNTNLSTGEEYDFTKEHLAQLQEFEVEQITNSDRYLLMLQTGDEVLDYKMAIEKYAAVPSIVEEGGGHGFMGFDRHIETVLAFCGINCLKTYS